MKLSVNEVEIMNTINNNKDDDIKKSRKWVGGAMNGTWDGNGIWYKKDEKWDGSGTWKGGMIDGNWNVKGNWKSVSDVVGYWEGKGDIISRQKVFPKFEGMVNIIGLFSGIVVAALGLFINPDEFNITIIIVLVIAVLTVLTKYYLKSTTKGKLRLKGSWKDEGEYRILTMDGDWNFGYHRGTIKGIMKDPKPKD